MIPEPNPSGLCMCGCGEYTHMATHNNTARGFVKGRPMRFLPGHASRVQKVRPEEERFWEKVGISGPDECWEWKASKNTGGYGHMSFRGRIRPSNQIAWVLTHGEYDPQMNVLHTCDNRPCCNPNHLFLGTHKDNMADMMRKGRRFKLRKGIALTEDEVREIRLSYQKGETQKSLAQRFSISQPMIGKIVRRESWATVD